MSPQRHQDDLLKAALEEAHEALDPPTPGFRRVWARARDQQPARQRSWRLRWAVAATLALAMALPWVRHLPQFGSSGPSARMSEEEALLFAEDLSRWGSALEFLDQTPGLELFDSFPELYRQPWDFDGVPEIQENTPGSRVEGSSRARRLPPMAPVPRAV